MPGYFEDAMKEKEYTVAKGISLGLLSGQKNEGEKVSKKHFKYSANPDKVISDYVKDGILIPVESEKKAEAKKEDSKETER